MQVLGHRGMPDPAAHAENTVAAAVAALDAGADGVEVDVQLTADEVAVCFHDDDLARVLGAPGLVRDRTWAQLQALRTTSGHRVPRLDELLTATAGQGQVVLDLKPERRTPALVRAVSAAVGRGGGHVVASSFDLRVLSAFALQRPDLSRALLCDVGCDPRRAVRECVADGSAGLHLALDTALAHPEALRAARAAQVQVRVWTVNRLVDAQLLELLGAQAVITDRPDRLVAGLRAAAAVG